MFFAYKMHSLLSTYKTVRNKFIKKDYIIKSHFFPFSTLVGSICLSLFFSTKLLHSETTFFVNAIMKGGILTKGDQLSSPIYQLNITYFSANTLGSPLFSKRYFILKMNCNINGKHPDVKNRYFYY